MSFEVFADDLGTTRKIEVAVKHTLRGNAKLREWSEDRILCGVDPASLPAGYDRPLILVCGASERFTVLTSGEIEVQAGVFVTIFFDEHRHEVADTEATVKSVVHEIDQSLFANYYLRVAVYSNESLIERIVEAETVDYEPELSGRGDVIGQRLVRGYVFEYTETATTGAPA